MKWQDIEICNCMCHREGTSTLHFMSCCRLCYDKYLTKDGKIIPEKIQQLLRESHLETFKRQKQKDIK